MNKDFPFEVIGSGRNSLIVSTPEGPAYIRPRAFATLCTNSKMPYRVVTLPERQDPRTGHRFPSALWVEVAQYSRF